MLLSCTQLPHLFFFGGLLGFAYVIVTLISGGNRILIYLPFVSESDNLILNMLLFS